MGLMIDRTALARLTAIEKAALLSGSNEWTSRGNARAGIPSFVMSDGPHGLRRQLYGWGEKPREERGRGRSRRRGGTGGEAPGVASVASVTSVASVASASGNAGAAPDANGGGDHLGLGASMPATCFPTATALADSWNPDLAEAMGRALGAEARSEGVNVVLGPGINIKRSPLCGRNFEYYSEDPLLAGRMAAGLIRGVQSRGVAACPKHFAANSQELRRQSSNSIVDERTLREIYLTAFEIAVRESHPWAIMSSYNQINGVYAHENRHLLTDILRREWGFDGAVISDWGGSNSAVAAARAGGSLEMPSPGYTSARALLSALRHGRLSMTDLDDRVIEVARLAERTRRDGRDGRTRCDGRARCDGRDGQGHATNEPRVPAADVLDAHHALARRVAEESAVLLKNDAVMGVSGTGMAGVNASESAGADGSASALPLAEGTRIAVIGDMARTPRYQGSGSSKVNAVREENLLDELRAIDGVDVRGFAQGYDRHGGGETVVEHRLNAEAARLAGRADVDAVVVVAGLDERSEAEGLDRAAMAMPGGQNALIETLADVCAGADAGGVRADAGDARADAGGARADAGQTGSRVAYDARARHRPGARRPRKPLIVVLVSGSPVETPWVDRVDAVLYTALAGQAGASAAARILTGTVGPSGRLAETWPLALADTPTADWYPAAHRDAVYREGSFVGYRYYETAGVPVRFPFGFGLGYARFSYSDLRVDGAGVTFMVTNESDVPGAAVPQLYVRGPWDEAAGQAAGVVRPTRELKGFAKVWLGPHEEREVRIGFDRYTFRHYGDVEQADAGAVVAGAADVAGAGGAGGAGAAAGKESDTRTAIGWCVESGDWTVMIGENAHSIVLSGVLTIAATADGAARAFTGDLTVGEGTDDHPTVCPGAYPTVPPRPANPKLGAYLTGRVKQATDEALAALFGQTIDTHAPDGHASKGHATGGRATAGRPADAGVPATFGPNDPVLDWVGSPSPIARGIARHLIDREIRARERTGEPDLDTLFKLNMPPRVAVKLAGGKVGFGMVQGAVDIANGRTWRGLWRMGVSYLHNRTANKVTIRRLHDAMEAGVDAASGAADGR